ncbi:MAG: hypothetical protein ACI9JT_000686 [Polaribacter sp.]|jgi:hypothetical protein
MTSKIKIAIILILFLIKNSYTQSEKWSIYDLDSIVSLKMPFAVYEIDTIIKYNKLYQIYSENNSSKFVAQKLSFGQLYANIEVPPLPKSAKELKKMYLNAVAILNEMIQHNLNYEEPIKKNNLDGYKVIYNDTLGNKVQQTHLFFVNKNLYSFSSFNENGINGVDNSVYFNSITFNNDFELAQYPKIMMSFQKKTFLILVIVLFLSFIFRYLSKR